MGRLTLSDIETWERRWAQFVAASEAAESERDKDEILLVYERLKFDLAMDAQQLLALAKQALTISAGRAA